MSWYSKQIAEGIRKNKYHLPELRSEDEADLLISYLNSKDWHVRTETDLKNHYFYVTTRDFTPPIFVAQFIRNLGYKVSIVQPPQPKSKKSG